MFYAFSRFHSPKNFAVARSEFLGWVRQAERAIYLETVSSEEPVLPASLQKRALTDAEMVGLEILVDNAWQQLDFGGYSTAGDSAVINGYCHFGLDETHTQARLLALLVEAASDLGDPLQSATLQLGLSDLLRETPHLEEIYLPFLALSAQAQADLAGLNFLPGDNPGFWLVDYEVNASNQDEGEEEDYESETNQSEADSPQSWLELSVRAEPEAVEAITELFARYGYNQGVVIEETVQPGPDGGALRDVSAPVIIRTYIVAGAKALAGIEKLREGLFYLGKLRHIEELQVTERFEEDWANAWKEFYQVHRVGRRTVIKPPWQEYAALPEDIIVEIDPGMAFGTGLHPTTRLCLQLMEDHLNPTQHLKALDLGTGSGILAIAAARLGVPYILGLDTDGVAVRAARENVERNAVTDQVLLATGSLAIEVKAAQEGGFYAFGEEEQRPPAFLPQVLPFDAIIANIIARVLISLAEPMAAALRPGGLLITSGIIGERADDVATALEAAGLSLVERREENDWVAFAHRREI